MIATRYLSVPINSVDAERSFSAYNNVLTDKRHNLTEVSTETLVKLYYNSAVDHQASIADYSTLSYTHSVAEHV